MVVVLCCAQFTEEVNIKTTVKTRSEGNPISKVEWIYEYNMYENDVQIQNTANKKQFFFGFSASLAGITT
jgi:hypothetical protein